MFLPIAPAPPGSKVAIPRSTPQPDPNQGKRVKQACTACKSSRIKCSGDNPECKQCRKSHRQCVYLRRKDQMKMRNGQMARLLEKLRAFASNEDRACIAELLEAAAEDETEARQVPVSSNPCINDEAVQTSTMSDPDKSEPWETSNTDPLDLVDEDLLKTHQASATGFLGPSSEVQWLRSFLFSERRKGEMASCRPYSFGGFTDIVHVSTVTFYLDDCTTNPGCSFDHYALPTVDAAKQLVEIYMGTVQDSFPILPRKLLQEKSGEYIAAMRHDSPKGVSPKLQAMLNLVFAIASKHSSLVQADLQTHERNHSLYLVRALSFAHSGFLLEQHPDLPHIQVVGLLAFYYLSIGHLSRACVYIGVALRAATALGLHARNEDPSAPAVKRERLGLIWWSLYYVERQLGVITGRPSVIVDSCCSVSLPGIDDRLSEGQASRGGHLGNPLGSAMTKSNTLSYFNAVVQICIIKQSILNSLYSAGAMTPPPSDLDQDVVQNDKRINDWALNLPAHLNFQTPADHADNIAFRQRMILYYHFYSAKMLLTRRYLNESTADNNGGSASASFKRRMADICVDAAKTVVGFLPDQPQAWLAYEIGPWWTLVHHVMQAFAVLLLSLAHSPAPHQDKVMLAEHCIKVIRWLHLLNDPQAQRAHQVATRCYEIVAIRLSLPEFQPWPAIQFPDCRVGQVFVSQSAASGASQTVIDIDSGASQTVADIDSGASPTASEIDSWPNLRVEVDGVLREPAFHLYMPCGPFNDRLAT